MTARTELPIRTIVIASNNPVKIQAALDGFQRMFPGERFRTVTAAVPSGVSHQPFSDQETLQGALNRARRAEERLPEADYWVGIEGGIAEAGEDMVAFAWVAVISKGQVGKGRTGTFYLPERVAELIRAGKELGEADDIVFNRTNSKQENGAVGILTDNVIDRAQFYVQAVILALIPHKNTELYQTVREKD